MTAKLFFAACFILPIGLVAQQPDSTHAHGDSLARHPVQVQAITVTATPARREDASTAVQVSRAAVQATPAINAYDLVRQTAGIEVHDQGQGPGFASDASVRGFSSDHSTDIALWIDGVPNNEPFNGHAEGYNDWSLLFPDLIEGIDVIKGPSSPLYGNFAFAGVVNVRTLDRMRGSEIALTGGSYGHAGLTFLTGYDHPDGGGILAFRGEREDGWRPNAGYRLGQLNGRFVRNIGGLTSLDASVSLYGTSWDSPGFLSDSQFQARDFGAVSNATDGGFKRHASERASLRVITGSGAVWRTTAYSTQGRWQLFLTIPPEPGSGEGSGSQTEEEDTRLGLGLTSAVTWGLPRGDLTLGVEGRLDHADYGRYFTTDRTRDSADAVLTGHQASMGLFLASNTDLTRHLRLSVGGRLDALRTSTGAPDSAAASAGHSIVSPKLGLLYHLPRFADLYATLSRGFRQADGVIEDPTVGFITEWAYEAGIKADLGGVNADVALYRMDVSREETLDPITLQPSIGGSSRRQGVELGLRGRLSPMVGLHGQWTFTDAKYVEFVTEDSTDLAGKPVYNTAKYVGEVGVDIGPADARWSVGVSANAVGPYTPFDEPGVELPAYGLAHLTGSVRLGKATLQLGIRNLFDHDYPELRAGGFVSPGQPRTLFTTLRYDW
jgi:outer membrane receptor protein involved in Fe transport